MTCRSRLELVTNKVTVSSGPADACLVKHAAGTCGIRPVRIMRQKYLVTSCLGITDANGGNGDYSWDISATARVATQTKLIPVKSEITLAS